MLGKYSLRLSRRGSETNVVPDGQRLEWTKTSFDFWMAKPWVPIKGTDSKIHSGQDKAGQFLTCNKGRAYCGACAGKEIRKKTVNQHMARYTHIAKVAIKEKKDRSKNTLIPALQQSMRDRESSGQTFSGPLKAIQMGTLEQLCRGNMSSHSFQEMATYMDRHTQQGLYIGNVVDLVD